MFVFLTELDKATSHEESGDGIKARENTIDPHDDIHKSTAMVDYLYELTDSPEIDLESSFRIAQLLVHSQEGAHSLAVYQMTYEVIMNTPPHSPAVSKLIVLVKTLSMNSGKHKQTPSSTTIDITSLLPPSSTTIDITSSCLSQQPYTPPPRNSEQAVFASTRQTANHVDTAPNNVIQENTILKGASTVRQQDNKRKAPSESIPENKKQKVDSSIAAMTRTNSTDKDATRSDTTAAISHSGLDVNVSARLGHQSAQQETTANSSQIAAGIGRSGLHPSKQNNDGFRQPTNNVHKRNSDSPTLPLSDSEVCLHFISVAEQRVKV
ncbi:hypothetical protein SARC_07266 [Sphaeroforma arctica JP610]|uniref:Uncharacterized protein n=1 Tax=Sphaeroforma arctica JP610 TaxID=667725 RepID=A0A0L0FUX6_9EUKA|nr:hypothetical protein SARC_07266 [Sphaeroforma arctica JP610]KNC80366.1 hypothetical protein SARC_07266 [Sphaeroforma arctica JP610]|eukprot:XP_014154268.1 hypothetical protein SARC_07266 [Sphaeroforma arctica JP610]